MNTQGDNFEGPRDNRKLPASMTPLRPTQLQLLEYRWLDIEKAADDPRFPGEYQEWSRRYTALRVLGLGPDVRNVHRLLEEARQLIAKA